MHGPRLTYFFLSSFLAAVFFLQWWQLPRYPLFVWLLLSSLIFIGFTGFLINSRARPARRSKSGGGAPSRSRILVLPISLGLTLAFLTLSRTTHVSSPESVDFYANGNTVEITGIIAEEPDKRSDSIRYTIQTSEIILKNNSKRKVAGRVLISDSKRWPVYAYGDAIKVKGVLEKPGIIEDFHYEHYLSRYNIYATMNRAMITPLYSNSGNALFAFLYSLKAAFEDRIATLYGEPHASLLMGLLTGSRRGIPEDLQNDFQITGLTHLVAISGYNITMVITVLSLLLFWLPLRWRFLPSVLLISCFTLFTGASASVVRAAVMGILGLLAVQTSRLPLPRLTVMWTAFFMLMWNPKQLWYDAGFQLSFLSLLGLMEISPLLENVIKFLPQKFGIRESMQLTLSAQIATLPLILFQFGRLSLIAPLSNLLVPPAVPYAMLFGLFSVLLSTISNLLGRMVAIPAFLCLTWITTITHLLACLPLASFAVPGVSAFMMAGAYAGLVAWRVRSHKQEH